MQTVPTGDVVRRFRGNPLITDRDLTFRCADICTAGATRFDGEFVLLVTVQSLEGLSAIYPAFSKDGYSFDVGDEPLISPSPDKPYIDYNQLGVMDSRITCLDGVYYLMFDAVGHHGYRLEVARTEDFKTIERLGFISEPDTKGGALFPKRIDGKYVRLERPWAGGSIWLSRSEDLLYWGWSEAVMTPRRGFWDTSRIGVATPPIEIDEGWFFIYYGVKETSAGPLFRLGAAVLEHDNPSVVRYRTNIPILSPREEYERVGDVPNLVFSCGAILEPNGEVKLYYGASNSCICMGTAALDDILTVCKESFKEF